MCGSLWLNSTARPPTSHLTPTCILSRWAGWVDRETSIRTTSWNCWGRNLTPRWSASQSAKELPSDANDPSVDGRFVAPLTPGESIERIWQSCQKAASGCDCDNIGAVQRSDKHPGTNGAVSATALLLWMERQGNATGLCVHYSLTDSIFLFSPLAAILNIFCILFHGLFFYSAREHHNHDLRDGFNESSCSFRQS